VFCLLFVFYAVSVPVQGCCPNRGSSSSEETGFVNNGGVQLFYRAIKPRRPDRTPPPPIVFVHGATYNSDLWECQQYYFAEQGYSTVAFDLRGHGRSTKPTNATQLTISAFVSDIAAIITQRRLVRPVVVGWSLGGAWSLVYALGNQAQLTGVVTVGTGLNSAQTTPTAGAATLLLLTAPSLDEFAVTFAGIAVNEQCDEASSVRNKLIAATKKSEPSFAARLSSGEPRSGSAFANCVDPKSASSSHTRHTRWDGVPWCRPGASKRDQHRQGGRFWGN